MSLTADSVRRPVPTVPAAVKRLQRLGAMLEEHDDGLRHFNGLYLDVTSLIQTRLAERTKPPFFLDKKFLRALDVAFANRYLVAVGNGMSGGPVSRPWRAFLEYRREPGILPVQFAVAGVNVHINYDLAQALVTAWERVPHRPGDEQRRDYDQVNAVFAALYRPLRHRLAKELARVDRGWVQKELDASSAFMIKNTRGLAWKNAEALAGANGGFFERAHAALTLEKMNRLVSASTRALLQPLR